jgi:hypothetical protein
MPRHCPPSQGAMYHRLPLLQASARVLLPGLQAGMHEVGAVALCHANGHIPA